jgi:hypothetical protein
MKNIHILPTDKPSRIRIGNNGNFVFGLMQNSITSKNDSYTNQNIYITSDEYIGLSYYLDGNLIRKGVIDDKQYWEVRKDYKKIILTDNPYLIKNGVQAIDDEFLQWFVKNPSCERVEVKEKQHFEADKSKRINPLNGVYYSYKIIIPKEERKYFDCQGIIKEGICFCNRAEAKQETLEEAAEKWHDSTEENKGFPKIKAFKEGAKWQEQNSDKKYSEEEVRELFNHYKEEFSIYRNLQILNVQFEEWFEQFKK